MQNRIRAAFLNVDPDTKHSKNLKIILEKIMFLTKYIFLNYKRIMSLEEIFHSVESLNQCFGSRFRSLLDLES